jgi:hypothetical protein
MNKPNNRLTVVVNVERLRTHPEPRKVVLLPVQVAALTGHSTTKLARMRRSCRGPRFASFGRHVLYHLSDVLAWQEASAAREVSHGA